MKQLPEEDDFPAFISSVLHLRLLKEVNGDVHKLCDVEPLTQPTLVEIADHPILFIV